jgi:hypothetical protein
VEGGKLRVRTKYGFFPRAGYSLCLSVYQVYLNSDISVTCSHKRIRFRISNGFYSLSILLSTNNKSTSPEVMRWQQERDSVR